MKRYPVNLSIEGRACLVVGGGAVASRKVRELLECGGAVTVTSPGLEPYLDGLARDGSIIHINRDFSAGGTRGFFLVIAATDDDALNETIGEEAAAHGTLVNVASAGAHSVFTNPAVLRRGELMITVSTGATSPALSRLIKRELEALYGPEYGLLAEITAAIRKLPGGAAKSAAPVERLVASGLIEMLRDGRLDEADAELRRLTGRGFGELGVRPPGPGRG